MSNTKKPKSETGSKQYRDYYESLYTSAAPHLKIGNLRALSRTHKGAMELLTPDINELHKQMIKLYTPFPSKSRRVFHFANDAAIRGAYEDKIRVEYRLHVGDQDMDNYVEHVCVMDPNDGSIAMGLEVKVYKTLDHVNVFSEITYEDYGENGMLESVYKPGEGYTYKKPTLLNAHLLYMLNKVAEEAEKKGNIKQLNGTISIEKTEYV